MADKLRTQPQVVRLMKKRGLHTRMARYMSAIAMCEAPAGVNAEGIPLCDFGMVGDQALADDKWGFSYGGFQIRSLREQKGTGQYRDEDKLVFVGFNCDSAVTILHGSGLDSWSTYSSGMYKAYLQDLFPPPPDTHIVVYGESLSSIAQDYRTTWQELARLNNIKEPYTIYIGQAIRYI